MQTFTKFVEVGRVAKVNYGGQEGSLAVIVDIVNDNRVLVDGDKIARQVIPIKRLSLTKFKVPVGRGARTGVVRKIIAKEGIAKKWADSHLGKTAANRVRRAQLNDFERFKVMVLRKRVKHKVNGSWLSC
jgi:large subunit ribosomal protein L14e